MIHKDVDASLCAAEPLLESLDDGFSPPEREPATAAVPQEDAGEPPEQALGTKSPF
jgi:hypothetical protein